MSPKKLIAGSRLCALPALSPALSLVNERTDYPKSRCVDSGRPNQPADVFFWWPVHFVFTVVRPKSFTQPLYLLHLKSLLLVQRPGVQRRSAGLKPKFQNMVLGAGSGYYRSQNWMMHTFTEKTEKLMFHGKDPGVL